MVVANGTGVDLNMDHHRFYPHAILWSSLSLGAGGTTTDHLGNRKHPPAVRCSTAFISLRPSCLRTCQSMVNCQLFHLQAC